jgi:hypothetical protein
MLKFFNVFWCVRFGVVWRVKSAKSIRNRRELMNPLKRRFPEQIRALLSAKTGANSRDRTDDLRITNALLYQLSYVGVTKNGLKDS